MSDKIEKINDYGFKSERLFLVTNKAIYNIKSNDLRRRTEYKDILGLTISKVSFEFVIHCSGVEYDYWYSSFNRRLIIEVINEGYSNVLNKEINICEVDEDNLKCYVTWKKEKYKDLNFTKMPRNTIQAKDFLYGNISALNFTNNSIINSKYSENNNSFSKRQSKECKELKESLKEFSMESSNNLSNKTKSISFTFNGFFLNAESDSEDSSFKKSVNSIVNKIDKI